MDISALDQNSLEELEPLITKCKYLPFSEYGIKQNLIVNNVIEELSRMISQDGFVFIGRNPREVTGIISLERLDWDSNHFGVQSGKIKHLIASGNYSESSIVKQKLISHLLTECCKKLLLHVSARVYKEDLSAIHALESKLFRLMDVLVTYSFNLQKLPINETYAQNIIRQYRQEELPELAEIAVDCFSRNPVATDRFHADAVLSKEKSSELYVKWILDCCKDSHNTVLVAELDGKPVGFNICNANEPTAEKLGVRLGTIALTAVKPEARRKQIATSLLNASLKWFTNKVDFVETGGQVSNYAIQRAWTKTGFKIIRSQCTFHWSVLPNST